MKKITKASLEDVKYITDFQCKMALQTEKLELQKELVHNALEYLFKNERYGFFLIAINNENEPIGSLMLTFQNQRSWWIQSVYVVQEHRRKGIFTSLFKESLKIAEQKNVKSIKLYAENDNQRAKQTYRKLGMECSGQKFYGYDLVYGKKMEMGLGQIQSDFSVKEDKILPQNQSLNKIFGKESVGLNKSLICLNGEQILGSCEYFCQFSQWRFGLTIYLNVLFSKLSEEKNVISSFLSYLAKNSQIKVGALRFLLPSLQDNLIMEICKDAHLEHYDIMAIYL